MSSQIRLVTVSNKPTVEEGLSELGRDLKALQTGEAKSDIVEYRREGYRFSVLIRPRDKESSRA
jgi:hypothetical protein